MGKSIWDTIAPVLGSVAAIGLGQPELLGPEFASLGLGAGGAAAIGSGVGSGLATGVETGNPIAGLGAGVLGGAGSYAGSTLLGPELSGLGSTANNVSGGTTPGLLGQNLGSWAGNATLGNLAGGAIGGDIGSSVGAQAGQMINPMSAGNSSPQGFQPSMSPSVGLPQSLSQFGSLSPNQQASNIATKGVYGGGNGPDETNYFMNLLNRQQFDQNGNLGQSTNVSPIEQSYLSQLGISNYSNPTGLLQGISQYGT